MSARYSATPAGLCRPRRGNWSRVGVRSAGCAYARAVLIRVLPYDPRWPVRFQHERAELEGLLAPWLSAGVHHIGSTSVPGLAAKPVIDMIAGVDDLAAAEAAVPVLESRSWVHAFHRPRALWFRKGTADQPTHALHLTEAGSDLWRER